MKADFTAILAKRSPIPPHSESRFVHPSRVSIGVEERTHPDDYYWHGLKRGGDPLHPVVLFQYTLSGHGGFDVRGRRKKIPPGWCFIARIPSDHIYYLPENSPSWRFFWIMISHPYVVERLSRIIRLSGNLLQLPEESLPAAESRKLWSDTALNSFADEFEQERALIDWSIELHRFAHQQRYPQVSRGHLMDQVHDTVLQQIHRPIDITELAIAHGMSRSHFSHHFKATTGISPAHYISRIRIDEAARLLRQYPPITLKEIAKKTGFADANHFCKCFRRAYHLSPGAYRRQMG